MTEKFIKRHCHNCEYWIHTLGGWGLEFCGEIDDEGCRTVGELLRMDVSECRKGFKK